MIQLTDIQQNAVNFTKDNPHSFLVMGTGTGKTYTSLFACKDKTPLIICENKEIKKQWQDSSEKAYGLVSDNIYTYYEFYRYKPDISKCDALIFDEAQILSSKSNRSKGIANILKKRNFDIILALSATPIRHEESDIYDIARRLNMKIPLLTKFKTKYEMQSTFYKDVEGFGFDVRKRKMGYTTLKVFNEDLINEYYSHVPRFIADQDIFEEYNFRVNFKKENMKMYNLLKRHGVVEGHFNNFNAGSKLPALQQMANSTFKYNYEDGIQVDDDVYKKIDYIKEIIKKYKKAVIVYKFDAERDLLLKSIDNSTDNIEEFESGLKDVYLRQIERCRGKDMYAQCMIFLTLNYSAENFDQMKGRITRMNASYRTVAYFYLIFENTIENELWEVVNRKLTKNELIKKL